MVMEAGSNYAQPSVTKLRVCNTSVIGRLAERRSSSRCCKGQQVRVFEGYYEYDASRTVRGILKCHKELELHIDLKHYLNARTIRLLGVREFGMYENAFWAVLDIRQHQE